MAESDFVMQPRACYVWPPRWLGDAPAWADPVQGQDILPIRATDLADRVLVATLPDDFELRLYRDGMIALRFRASEDSPSLPGGQFIGFIEETARCLNAYLACLWTVAPMFFRCSVVTIWSLMQVDDAGRWMGSSNPTDGRTLSELSLAREEQVGATAHHFDWRYTRPGPALNQEVLIQSVALFRQLLELEHRDRALLRAELLLRAGVAQMDQDQSGALTNAWTAMEGLLGDLLRQYLDEVAGRPTGDGSSFMPSKRRKFFEGSEMTSRHMAEILSLAGKLPHDLYRSALQCARARNNWLHTETPPSRDDAHTAIVGAGKLFELVDGVPLHLMQH